MSKLNFDIKDKALHLGVDYNEDGESSIKMKLNMIEAVGEAFSRGEAVEGVKLVDFKFELTKMILKLDSDRDGESVLELVIDLGEIADEVKGLFSKKEEV